MSEWQERSAGWYLDSKTFVAVSNNSKELAAHILTRKMEAAGFFEALVAAAATCIDNPHCRDIRKSYKEWNIVQSEQTCSRHNRVAKLPWRPECPGDSCASPSGSHLKQSVHHVWANPSPTLISVLFMSDRRWLAGTAHPAALYCLVWGTETVWSIGGTVVTEENRCRRIITHPNAVFDSSCHIHWPGIEHGPPRWEACDYPCEDSFVQ